MLQRIRLFQADESGQDLIEYSLLICFIAIASMWLLGAGQPAVNQIWTTGNAHLTKAHQAAN